MFKKYNVQLYIRVMMFKLWQKVLKSLKIPSGSIRMHKLSYLICWTFYSTYND